jgi:hypothetical protein
MNNKFSRFLYKLSSGLMKVAGVLLSILVILILMHSFFEFVGWLMNKTSLSSDNIPNHKLGAGAVMFVLCLGFLSWMLVDTVINVVKWIIQQWKDS